MKVLLSMLSLMILVSCSSFKSKRVGAKESDEKASEITDNWVSEDTRRVIKDVLKQMKTHKGFKKAIRRFRDPKLFVAEVQNNTAEAYFPIDDMNDEFLYELSRTGDFTLIDENARDKILEEITYQNDGMVDPTQAKQIGKQYGADLMIFGNVYMKPEKRDGKKIKEYSVNLRMTDIQKGIEVFRARTKIYKYSDKASFGW